MFSLGGVKSGECISPEVATGLSSLTVSGIALSVEASVEASESLLVPELRSLASNSYRRLGRYIRAMHS
jgi:hypothetical protein